MKSKLYFSFLLAIAVLSPFFANSQTMFEISDDNRTFVFKITNEEALKLIKEENSDIFSRYDKRSMSDSLIKTMLHTHVATFTEKWDNKPQYGHFVYVKLNNPGRVNYSYEPVIPFNVISISEWGNIVVQIIDSLGNPRGDAKIKVGDKVMQYDKTEKTYTIKSPDKKKIDFATVELDGYFAVFDCIKRSFGYGGTGSNALSYMITDKQKYKPKDKVRFKSFSLYDVNKPVSEELYLWLYSKNYNPDSTLIDKVKPYRKGGYTGEFNLTDSLRLSSDNYNYYTLQLRDKNSKIISSTQFEYEDYVLKDQFIKHNLKYRTHYGNQDNEISVTVKDANNFPINGATLNIIVKRFDIKNNYSDVLIIPDTIINTTIPIEVSRATIFRIPVSVFGKSDCEYSIDMSIKTFDNRIIKIGEYEYCRICYFYNKENLSYSIVNDTILYTYSKAGIEQPIEGVCKIGGIEKIVKLPYKQKINTDVANYEMRIKDSDCSINIPPYELPDLLKFRGEIRKDTIYAEFDNPQNVELRWSVYCGNKLIKKGVGKEFKFIDGKVNEDVVYYFDANYQLYGSRKNCTYKVVSDKNKLRVDVDFPKNVYPGQKIDATVSVTDYHERPVKNADLTAFAYNAQLDYDLNYINCEAPLKERKLNNEYRFSDDYSSSSKFDYNFWNEKLKLDTITSYKFRYPRGKLFSYTATTPNGTTEMAPFVMRDGEPLKIFVIEIDDEPVYFSWTNQIKSYSFIVKKPVADIKLRLSEGIIKLNNIKFKEGKKTILSVDIDSLPESVVLTGLEKENSYDGRLTSSEVGRYNGYIARMPLRANYNFIKQDSVTYPLAYGTRLKNNDAIMVGPITEGRSLYNGDVPYDHINGFSYLENKGAMENIGAFIYNTNLNNYEWYADYKDRFKKLSDVAITHESIVKNFEKYKNYKWNPKTIRFDKRNINLTILLPENKGVRDAEVLLFKDSETDEIKYCYRNGYISNIDGGTYNIIMLYSDGSYIESPAVPLKSFVYVSLDLKKMKLNPADLKSDKYMQYSKKKYTADETIRNYGISGYVTNEKGEPMSGVDIYVQGSPNSQKTGWDGFFHFYGIDTDVILLCLARGYEQQLLKCESGSCINISMYPSEKTDNLILLHDVVVFGATPPDGISIRGGSFFGSAVTSVSKGDGSLSSPQDSEISEEEDAVSKLYNELLTIKTIRKNFSDVGFWEPILITDNFGKAKFNITFPDNITRWNTAVYAMNEQAKFGSHQSSIFSYKPIMAELKTPRFLVEGDTSCFIGTVRNYSKDSLIFGKTYFSTVGKQKYSKDITVGTIYIDKDLEVVASGDTTKIEYEFRRNDGYIDGEQREIPVNKQGTVIADGYFDFLEDGKSVEVLNTANDKTGIIISGNQLDIYLQKIDYLIHYPYSCNEQLASRLIALINNKLYNESVKKRFEYDKQVKEIINILQENRKGYGWTWFGQNGNILDWVTTHVNKALFIAEKAGYKIEKREDNELIRNLTDMEYALSVEDIHRVYNLFYIGESPFMLRGIISKMHKVLSDKKNDDVIKREYNKHLESQSYFREKLMLWEMESIYNRNVVADSLRKYMKYDIIGGIYFDDQSYDYDNYWNNNRLTNTILAYRMVKNDPSFADSKDKILLYIMGTMRNTYWNTYYSALALSEIFPDLLVRGFRADRHATVVVSGSQNQQVTKFPYKMQLDKGEKVTIKKTDGIPLMYSVYKEKIVTKADSNENFSIETKLSSNYLKAGEIVELKVDFNVKKENANYVVLDIPIPASCGYLDSDNYHNYYSNRQYLKDRVVVMYDKLSVGSYTIYIKLIPQYTGYYTINPAKIEMMYFPTVNANSDMRKVKVNK